VKKLNLYKLAYWVFVGAIALWELSIFSRQWEPRDSMLINAAAGLQLFALALYTRKFTDPQKLGKWNRALIRLAFVPPIVMLGTALWLFFRFHGYVNHTS
jgi:hypothetical protein